MYSHTYQTDRDLLDDNATNQKLFLITPIASGSNRSLELSQHAIN